MGILDEAIKEHLELKRQHGAGDSELQKIEDEAFGPPERPGSELAVSPAEAPTEFMAEPAGAEEAPPRRRAPDVADLQEAPEPESEPPAEEEQRAEEEQPAMEHEAIAEQPTELYDVEEEFASSEPAAPSEEELVEAEIGEPRLAPVDPLAGAEEEEAEAGEEEDDDFFDEQRLSDELDQALEAPAEPEPEPEEEDLEPEEEQAPQGPDEDLLEETPDFLEEAPEDDQLWFEQKPPKDFDFDD